MYEYVYIEQVRNIDTALSIIKEFEGFRDTVYHCQAGAPTIGYGHILKDNAVDKKYLEGGKITKKEAERLLIEDLQVIMNEIDHLVLLPFNDNQYAALLSFTYNVGIKAFGESSLLKELNGYDFESAANEFTRWNKITVNGVKLTSDGLTYRRAKEKELFLTPVFNFD